MTSSDHKNCMPDINYLNLEDTNLDTPIYRIMSIFRILQMLQSRSLSLVKPKLWDDPYENWKLSSEFLYDDEKVTFAARDSVYGQCWTWHQETDAIWRIYSAQKDGVRISTTPRRLFESLKVIDQTWWEVRCFIGQVAYHTLDELQTKLDEIPFMTQDVTAEARSLLYKRVEFDHESEVRVIYVADDQSTGPDHLLFQIDPMALFDEFTFDPRMDDVLVDAYALAIKNAGVRPNLISKSTFYGAPKKHVFPL
jgi:hypothetical protein